jgi:hypothetical protein
LLLLVGFIIRIFKTNIQQKISYLTFRRQRIIWTPFFSLCRWTNSFLNSVTVGSNPAHNTIFSPVFVLHCEGTERLYHWLISHLTKSIALQSTINTLLSIIRAMFQISLQQKYFLSCLVRNPTSLILYEFSQLFQILLTAMIYITLRNTSALLTDAFSGAKKCQDRSSALFFRTTSVKSTNIHVLEHLHFVTPIGWI